MNRRDDGAATVEFVALTLVLLLPVLYLVVALSRVQAGAYAAEAAAYAAARGAVVAGLGALDAGQPRPVAIAGAEATAGAAAVVVAGDFGIDDVAIELACDGVCLAPGSAVTVMSNVTVPLPGVPAALRAVLPLEVSVGATAASPVDGYVP